MLRFIFAVCQQISCIFVWNLRNYDGGVLHFSPVHFENFNFEIRGIQTVCMFDLDTLNRCTKTANFPTTILLGMGSCDYLKNRHWFPLFFLSFSTKVSRVRWAQPTRLYSVSGLTKDVVESRVLTVCKAFDKITADKVTDCRKTFWSGV